MTETEAWLSAGDSTTGPAGGRLLAPVAEDLKAGDRLLNDPELEAGAINRITAVVCVAAAGVLVETELTGPRNLPRGACRLLVERMPSR